MEDFVDKMIHVMFKTTGTVMHSNFYVKEFKSQQNQVHCKRIVSCMTGILNLLNFDICEL